MRPDGSDAPTAPDSAPSSTPTAQLWLRRSPRSPALASAAALTGVDAATLASATAVAVAGSPEAVQLLDGMEYRIRTLPTSVATAAERCVSSVRGPILWAETITARAHALGNEDVFVCMTTSRSFDRLENRLLVEALESISAATRALQGAPGDSLGPEELARVRAVAAEAARWRADSRLSSVRAGRLTGRAAARVRGGHRRASMEPVLALRQRAREPFDAQDVVSLTDEWTARLHDAVLRVLEVMPGPRALTLSDGGLWSQTLSFRHPAASGSGPSGLTVRGVPVLAPAEDVRGAPWEHLLPADGIRLPPDADQQAIRALLDQSVSSS